MTAASWRSIHPNAICMAVSEQGAGLPVVLCHGFPEIAYSWRHQMPALAAAGFRAIAPDQRGYGETDRPAAVSDYDIHQLTADLVGLLDALGLERAVFAGHDWGGIVVWHMPLLHPARTAGVIGVNTPYFPRPSAPPVTVMRALWGDDYYIVHFQKPGEARDGNDPGLRPLDAAGAARRALPHHDRLAHAPVLQSLSTAAAQPAGSSIWG